MDQIIVENVRCFRERQTVPLAPLTFLVGENSSGKSTLLALTRLVWDLANEGKANFNEEPFLLGAHQQIASQVGRKKAASTFTLGGLLSTSGLEMVSAQFTSRKGQPVLQLWSYKTSSFELKIEYDEDEKPLFLQVESSSESVKFDAEELVSSVHPAPWSLFLGIIFKLSSSILGALADTAPHHFDSRFSGRSTERPYAFAPIRTRPQRTYDAVKEIVTPEGSHVPLILQGLFRDRESWQELHQGLTRFGQASGLFGAVEVKKFEGGDSSPFQVQVSIDGALRNFVDVGYGVSQALPILVDCLRGKDGATFLLQQPEVHLHPKAQSELSSFLALLAKQQNKQFLIETHSDYMVDRIRMDVRDGKHGLRPEDVSLLYFERQGGESHIHPLILDESGNIVNAPPGYRSFFLEEERRFLGG
jgi:energy-coupling factor transporter ATP-binding protein EcfA2